jgi:H+/Cl- antiporter ClcA
MFVLSCATHMRALLRLSLHVEILITGSTRLSLRNLESPLMIALLALSLLLAAYVHVVLLLILIMNELKNCCMLLMILCGHEDHCLRGVH